jgi:hypothetical protein
MIACDTSAVANHNFSDFVTFDAHQLRGAAAMGLRPRAI